MTLFRKSAYAEAGPAYDVRPVQPYAASGGFMAPINFIKNMGQGACAGLLTLLGAMHLTQGVSIDGAGLASLTSFDSATIDAVVEKLLAGGGPGVIEIIGAAALFMNAGRGWAKIWGLMGFVAIAVAHANGVDHAEFFEKVSEMYEFAQTTVHRFQAAQNAV
ncbi:MAG: hypothetical protein AAGJ87_11155 [Pseudomonadota bacterium]